MRYLEKIIPYKKETDEIKISGLGDIHIGNAGVDYKALDRSIKFILDNDCYVVGMGDYIEAILPNDPRFCMSAVDKRLSYYNIIDNEIDYVIDLLKPIPKEKWIIGLTGNHEEVVRRKYYREVTESQICKRLNIPYGSYSCYVRLTFRRGRHSETLKLYANHGYGNARFPPTKLWKLIHAREGRDVDLLMMGHVHELAVYTGKMSSISSRGRPKGIERPVGAMLTGHFLRGEVEGVDQYTEKFAANPSKTGIGTFTIRPEQHKIHGAC